jgi:hypothetical protein
MHAKDEPLIILKKKKKRKKDYAGRDDGTTLTMQSMHALLRVVETAEAQGVYSFMVHIQWLIYIYHRG